MAAGRPARAKQTFGSLSLTNKRGVFRRLREMLNADDPYSMSFVEMLKGPRFERLRKIRVGDFRVFFVIEPVEVTHLTQTYKGTLYLIDIRDRKEAYWWQCEFRVWDRRERLRDASEPTKSA